jgi:plasmid stabilization system protein ParE
MAAATVLFHRLALREYQAAQQWYARRSAQALQRFQDAVDHAVQQIANAPDQWPTCGPHHRWVRTGRFPYILFYRILDPDHVLVVAVAHARRRPGYWRRRTPP